MKTILIGNGIQAGGNLLNSLINIRGGKLIKGLTNINPASDGTKPKNTWGQLN